MSRDEEAKLVGNVRSVLSEHMIDPPIVIGLGEDGPCDLCHKVDELRPYGPNGENICYDCGMKDKASTERQMNKVLFGIDDAS